MSADWSPLRFLLDEHYPGWLADNLRDGGVDAVALVRDRPDLRGADDAAVLVGATAEGRIVVTEDVTTFAAAGLLVGEHRGIVYCHPARFPRTRAGLHRLSGHLLAFTADPPDGLGALPGQWWL